MVSWVFKKKPFIKASDYTSIVKDIREEKRYVEIKIIIFKEIGKTWLQRVDSTVFNTVLKTELLRKFYTKYITKLHMRFVTDP